MEERREYMLTDEQNSLIRSLLVNEITENVVDLDENVLDDLKCYEHADRIVEACETMRSLCRIDDAFAKDTDEEAEEPPAEDSGENRISPTRGSRERSCRTCAHCERTVGEGRGKTRYVCALSGADFAPGLVCECYERASAEE